MESISKRIIVVILIAVIAIVSGALSLFYYPPPNYRDRGYFLPFVPSDVDYDHILRIGIPGDVGAITGDSAWEGAYLAVKEINADGGVTVGVDTYYFGIIREDTDEDNPYLVTSRGIAAAERLVYDDDIDYAVGGFRTEAVLAYQEVFMDNEILFLSVGVTDDIFTQKVKNYYDRYKYYFRVMPTNSTSEGGQIFAFINYTISYLNDAYGVGTISEVGIIAENLNWADPIVDFLNDSIPYTGATIPEDCLIRIPYSYSLADYQPTIQTMIDNGIDLLIPVISSQYGIMMMQQYTELEPDFVVVGIDIQSQLDFFWEQSNEACAYETIMQGVYNVNKTPATQAFWAAFRAELGHDPLYIAIGAYDAIYYLSTAIQTVQTIETTDIIAHWETWTHDNPRVGVAGNYAWWPESHELVSGYPYMYSLWTQWQPDGTKIVIPGFGLYDDSLTTGAYTVPPWVHTTWTA